MGFYGAPGESRTPDLLVRSQSLYPTELRAHTIESNRNHRQNIRNGLAAQSGFVALKPKRSCYPETIHMELFHNSAFSRVTALAERRAVHTAFAWLHGNPKTIMDLKPSWRPFPRHPLASRPARPGSPSAFRRPVSAMWRPTRSETFTAGYPRQNCPPRAPGQWWCSRRIWIRSFRRRRRSIHW